MNESEYESTIEGEEIIKGRKEREWDIGKDKKSNNLEKKFNELANRGNSN